MASIKSILPYLLLFLALSVVACTKDTPVITNVPGGGAGSGTGSGTGGNPPPGTGNNPPPVPPFQVDAFPDVTIPSTMNTAMLNGIIYGSGGSALRLQWAKVSGPSSAVIERPDSLITRVSNLEAGTYRFSLTATGSAGTAYADTVTVQVQSSSPARQILFSGVKWVCPFGCSLYYGFINSYVPANTPISVYLRREGSQNWDIVVPEGLLTTQDYSFTMNNGQLSLFEHGIPNPTDRPEVKVTF